MSRPSVKIAFLIALFAVLNAPQVLAICFLWPKHWITAVALALFATHLPYLGRRDRRPVRVDPPRLAGAN